MINVVDICFWNGFFIVINNEWIFFYWLMGLNFEIMIMYFSKFRLEFYYYLDDGDWKLVLMKVIGI